MFNASAAAIDRLLRAMFSAAIASAQPSARVPQFLPPPPRGRLIVIGAGKASAAMAKAVEDNWAGPLEGVVVTRYGYAVPCERIQIIEAAHPVPDANGQLAAQRILQCVSGLTENDVVLCLISGGGSALLSLPLEGVTLEQKQDINRQLLASGASISEMNCVRRHLSAIKGGRLAAACHPARVVNLIISDVPADGLNDIASGPTVPDPTTCADALAVLNRYGIEVPPTVIALLKSGHAESLKADDLRLPPIESHLIATPLLALEAAAKVAEAVGVSVHVLSDAVEGEAREVGKVMAAMARHLRRHGQPFKPPCILLSGGETTVTVRGNGRGGR
jgi:hydroxypyruvate reductase